MFSNKLFRIVSISFLLFFQLTVTGLAQSSTATLSGIVTDETDAAIVGARIKVSNVETGFERVVITDEGGSFVVPLLPPSTYFVRVERTGFALFEARNVVLNVNDNLTLKVRLKVGEVGATVTVDETQSLIDESPAVSTVINRQFAENLPLNGRSIQSLIALTPGAVITSGPGQFSVNGQRTTTNYFTIDGVGANIGVSTFVGNVISQQNSGSLPGFTITGGTNNLITVDAIQEFKIQTSTFAPEFGRSPGAQVQIVSRSGSNNLRGSVFEYVRNEAFDAQDWFANRSGLAKAPLRQNQYGGTLGGPVFLPLFGEGNSPFYDGRNRTFFFFSFEGLRLQLPKTAIRTYPSLRVRQLAADSIKPLLNAFPIPTGPEFTNSAGAPTGLSPFVASYSDKQSLDAISFRIDHSFNDKISIFGRYNNADSSEDFRSTNLAVLIPGEIKTRTATFGTTIVFTPQITNEIRVNYSDNQGLLGNRTDNFGGAIPVEADSYLPPFAPERSGFSASVSLGGVGGTVSVGSTNKMKQEQFNLIDNLSVTKGSHQLKFGFDYRRLAPVYGPQDYFLSPSFSGEASLQNAVANSVFVRHRESARPIFTNFSLYGQDTWRATRRLTLTSGLRWEVNPPPTEADGKDLLTVVGFNTGSSLALAPSGTKLYQTTYNNFAPRLGAAFQLSQKAGRELVVRGGFGVFYDLGSGQTTIGYIGFPFDNSYSVSNVPFPIDPARVPMPSPPTINLPITSTIIASDPNLLLPYTLQWNLALEQSLGANQSVSATYVGAAGRRLLATLTRRNLSPNFPNINYTGNLATSDYHALQLQFERRLSKGLQVLSSYTWSHAIDEVSDESVNSNIVRGDANFDVRHNFSTALTYNLPTLKSNPFVHHIFGGWAIDSIIRVQTAPPFSITSGSFIQPDGSVTASRVNLIPGQPIYLEDPNAPGGRRLNRAAFAAAPAEQQGSLGRNAVRGFGLFQTDLAIRREFGLTERLKLYLRAEAFNVFNTPNFGSPNTTLTNPLFGESTFMFRQGVGGLNSLYQTGGPRSLQFAVRLSF